MTVRKRLEFLLTPKCLISIISVRIKYGPRSTTVQPLWLHKSLADSRCYSVWHLQRSIDMKLREGESMSLGKSDNLFNISTGTNVQACYNPSNHIKHPPQGPWAISHIKSPTCRYWDFMPTEHLMNSANFLLRAPILCGVLPLLHDPFNVYHLLQSAVEFIVWNFIYIQCPICGCTCTAQGQLL